VLGFDQAPVLTLLTVGFVQKSGTPCGIPLTPGVWRWASCAAAVATPQAATKAQVVMSGNEALAFGLIAAGVRFGAGYPITPWSDIMELLRRELPKYGGTFVQTEDEIAAVSMALGASYGGRVAVTGSSGPGISLKTEALGWASMAEVPVVIVDVQRGGPSTGMPTNVEQSDLNIACFGGHGDSPRVVIAPASVEEEPGLDAE